jgi:Zn-dependent protease
MDLDLVHTIQNIAIFFPAFLIALVVHEFAHAYVATLWGDETSVWSGRLTLNPLSHIDPIGTIVFPLISIALGAHLFFGWAKPVPINPNQFRHYRKGLFWVSSAGPIANILLGFLSAILLVGCAVHIPESNGFKEGLMELLKSLMALNFSLAIFNLLPVPPLDGSNIVLSFLSYNASRKFIEFQVYANYLLLFLMFTGALSVLSGPILLLMRLALGLAGHIFGIGSLA